MICDTWFDIQKQLSFWPFIIGQQFWLHFQKLGCFFQIFGRSVYEKQRTLPKEWINNVEKGFIKSVPVANVNNLFTP